MPGRPPRIAVGPSKCGLGTLLAEEEPTARLPRLYDSPTQLINSIRRHIMQWTTPSYTDLRFGFEITMYIANR
ncbi:coenzyme PQQ peptide PqqA [Burkholderia cepacia]|nr:coenzyme PQQ peptide PqqA [Burkholderia cepacia]